MCLQDFLLKTVTPLCDFRREVGVAAAKRGLGTETCAEVAGGEAQTPSWVQNGKRCVTGRKKLGNTGIQTVPKTQMTLRLRFNGRHVLIVTDAGAETACACNCAPNYRSFPALDN